MDELAAALAELTRAVDPYGFMDEYDTFEEAVEENRGLLSSDEGMRAIATWINEFTEEM